MTHPSNSYDTEQNSDFTRTDFSGNSDNKQPRWAKQSRLNLRTMLFEQFPDQAEEKLYQQYMRKQKLNAVPTLVVAGVIYTASQIGFEVAYISEQERRGQDVRLRQIIAHTLFLLVALLLFVPLQWCRTGPREWVVNVCVVGLWAVVTAAVLIDVGTLASPRSSSGVAVGWLQIVIFITFVVSPWRLRWCVVQGLAVVVVYSVEVALRWTMEEVEGQSGGGTSADVAREFGVPGESLAGQVSGEAGMLLLLWV